MIAYPDGISLVFLLTLSLSLSDPFSPLSQGSIFSSHSDPWERGEKRSDWEEKKIDPFSPPSQGSIFSLSHFFSPVLLLILSSFFHHFTFFLTDLSPHSLTRSFCSLFHRFPISQSFSRICLLRRVSSGTVIVMEIKTLGCEFTFQLCHLCSLSLKCSWEGHESIS